MFSAVGVICFAASYMVAWGLELLRLRTKRAFWGRLSVLALGAGLVAQTAFLYHHFILRNDHLVVSVAGWFYVLAWGLALGAFWLFFSAHKTPFSLFLIPAALVAIGAAAALPTSEFPAVTTARTLRAVHAASLFGSVAMLFFGGLTGLMYFVQSAKLHRPLQAPTLMRLPSLEWLEKALRRSTELSTLLLALGIVSGFFTADASSFPLRSSADVVNRGLSDRDGASNQAESSGSLQRVDSWGLASSDFLMIGASALFVFLIGTLIVARTHYAGAVRRTALLTIACFLALALILAVGILDPNAHWTRTPDSVPGEDGALIENGVLNDGALSEGALNEGVLSEGGRP